MSNEAEKIAIILDIKAEIVQHVILTLGCPVNAERWLTKPNRSLNGDSPLNRLKKEDGLNAVTKILQNIEYGGVS